MAVAAPRKPCSSISSSCKQMATTNCEGCLQAFCTKHFTEHRQSLGEELITIIDEHSSLYNAFSQPTEPNSHPFVKHIDQWEKEAITKIQKKAEELRLGLSQMVKTRKDEILQKLDQLSEKIKENKDSDNFLEMELQEWKTTLEDLKTKLDSSTTFSFDLHDDLPLVQDLSIIYTLENELFERVFDNNVQIQHDGHIVVHDSAHNYTEIRGKNEYTNGRHKIRLCIEQSADSWTFLGINSKPTLLQKQSSGSKSSYGWTSNNYYWLNGECFANKTNPRIEMKTNDIINLIFDCDNHKIFMINERTKAKYELTVNSDYCPFPWQLHLNLFEANSRIRVLSA